MSEIKFAIPKGSLENATFKLLEKSWTKVNRKSRTYRVYLDDPSIVVKMLRPQEIPTMVAEGLYDVGITGKDWVGETKAVLDTIGIHNLRIKRFSFNTYMSYAILE